MVSPVGLKSCYFFFQQPWSKVYQDVWAPIHFTCSGFWVNETTPRLYLLNEFSQKHPRNGKETCARKMSCFQKWPRFKPSMIGMEGELENLGQCCRYSLVTITPGCLRKLGPMVSGLQSHWYVGYKPVFPFDQWKNPGCLGYIGDYTTHLCGDYEKPL